MCLVVIPLSLPSAVPLWGLIDLLRFGPGSELLGYYQSSAALTV
jgi:hypothetical protein